MPILQVIILALVQGITEFLPISSTAHRSDGVHVRIVSPTPPMMPGARVARPLEASLEDAYLAVLAERRNEAAPSVAPRAAGVVA